ncbi:MAG TPA: iron dicitrate transport regulator FecR [Firmicutes bacterium]|jgi:NAD-dependent deacetylase|nr:iron dicitrate transport regulator FecR [Bacillota bacterium]
MSRIVALTGAGISVASGLPTFGEDTWRGRPVRQLLTKSFFVRYPEEFYNYYWEGLTPWQEAQPNAAHLALAQAGATIITQNIDGLHQAAGSQDVLELHGNLRELICEACGTLYAAKDRRVAAGVPHCPVDQQILKPNVVLFEEVPHGFDTAIELLSGADWLLVIGTSLQVAPACYLPEFARRLRVPVKIINDAAEIEVPRWLREQRLLPN